MAEPDPNERLSQMTQTATKEVTLKLGEVYEDAYTGYKGVAVIRNTELNDRTTIALSGKVNATGELTKHGWFAPERLRDEEGNPVVVDELSPSQIVLGRSYRDSITEFQGVATSRQDHVDGCLQYGLEGKVDKKTGESKAYLFDDARLVDPSTGRAATTTPAKKGPAHIHEIR